MISDSRTTNPKTYKSLVKVVTYWFAPSDSYLMRGLVRKNFGLTFNVLFFSSLFAYYLFIFMELLCVCLLKILLSHFSPFFFSITHREKLRMAEAIPEMPKYCCAVIYNKLRGEGPPEPPAGVTNDPYPVFVCLKTLDGALRGCIGNFAAEPLHKQLKDNAIAAAFQDTRFRPVTLKELPSLTCSVSVLHSFEQAARWDEWEVGTHGIRIRYKSYSATYLPSVMPEQGWDHGQAIRSLLKKAGYLGDVSEALLRELSVTRYRESKCTIAFNSINTG
uniref:Uncharacterized protein TCIL3000_11_14240 n=1 Tax=Trypanosoma congolense (strain IL3000) TaxID=1068625 RepID=G0V2N7_TRYCI|nr:unnamed protein product [Trypanosoma congolense IL3000]